MYIHVYVDASTNSQHTTWRINQHLLVSQVSVGFVKAETWVFPISPTHTRNPTKAHGAFLVGCTSTFLQNRPTGNWVRVVLALCSIMLGGHILTPQSAHTFPSSDIPVLFLFCASNSSRITRHCDDLGSVF